MKNLTYYFYGTAETALNLARGLLYYTNAEPAHKNLIIKIKN